MRNMSKKTWKLRVWNHMTEMQKLDILLKHAKVPHTYERRWPEMDRPDCQEYLPGGRHDGADVNQDIVNKIFEKFCLGK